MGHPELPIFSFLAAILVLVPLPWHWRARNVATLSLIVWLFIVNAIYCVNSVVWAGNVRKTLFVWCDITTKIVVGASYALPISTACICRHLELVASGRKVSFTYADRRRRMILEVVLCFGLPLVFMALHYIVQGHRFDIIENTGCQATVYVSVPAILIIWLPQLFFSVITMVYAVIALWHFLRQRLTFASHLRNSNSALTTSSYLRLIAMVIIEMLWGTVLTSVNMHYNVEGRLQPWNNWDDVHSGFSRIGVFPEVLIPPESRQVLVALWWAMPMSAFIFFLFFGFGGEAQKEYSKVLQWCRSITSRGDPPEQEELGSSNTRSSFLQLINRKKHSSKKTRPISNPILVSSSNPCIPALLASSEAKPEDLPSQVIATEGGGETAVDSSDTLTVSTVSVYAQPYYRASMVQPTSAQVDDQPPQLPDIFLSSLSDSPPPSPTSIPDITGSPSRKPSSQSGCSLSPTYHRPFCGPSAYPAAKPYPGVQQGSAATIHRRASAGRVV